MTNQTLHSQIPQSPSPSLEKVGGGLQIRLPIITPELQRLVEENKKLIKTALPAMEANERRIRELEKQNQQESLNLGYTQEDKELIQDWKIKYPDWYKENGKRIIFLENFIGIEGINGEFLKFERKDLSAPAKEVKQPFFTKLYDMLFESNGFLKEFGISSVDGFTYFTFDSAQEEAEKLGNRIPTWQNWNSTILLMPGDTEEEKRINLIKLLNLNHGGLCTYYSDKVRLGGTIGWYWTSSSGITTDKVFCPYSLVFQEKHIDCDKTRTRNDRLLVRCLVD